MIMCMLSYPIDVAHGSPQLKFSLSAVTLGIDLGGPVDGA
jgi:hypothetical protein